MKSIFLILIIALASNSFVSGQNHKKILLINGFLHVGNGETIPKALIGIENGKIALIKNALAYTYDTSDWDTIINLKGKSIYPGFVAPNSTLGITEIDAVRATADYDEVGTYNPHVRSQIAFNVESKVISTVRTNGVLLTQATPRGGIISGTSSLMAMDGWNWEDATIVKDDGVHLNWPDPLSYTHEKSIHENKNYIDNLAEINHFFMMAKAYNKGGKKSSYDARFEAMKECFDGEKRVYIHADDIQQLTDIIEFTQKFKLKFPVIIGGYDSHLVARKLKDAKIPVMLTRVHSLPLRQSDPVDLPYKLPYLLQQAGVTFCLQNHGDMEAMNARNIPFLAGTARAYGLTTEQAIQAVSNSACQIIGAYNYGSIEVGKNATLFVSTGDALDMRTNNLILALINGKFMSLENSQTNLYKKYKSKYAQ